MIMGCVFVSFSGSTRRQSSAVSDEHTHTRTHSQILTHYLLATTVLQLELVGFLLKGTANAKMALCERRLSFVSGFPNLLLTK